MSDLRRYSEIYDYVSDVPAPLERAGMVAYGRKDPLVAHAIGESVLRGKAEFVVITGGKGKDSGDLQDPEAVHLKGILDKEYPDLSIPVFLETKARNGAENSSLSLDVIAREGLAYEPNLTYQPSLTTLTHATSARRLRAQMEHEAIKRGTPIANLYGIPTNYRFNVENPADQEEAVMELLRLADWQDPEVGWLQPQTDLPLTLVDFANDIAIRSGWKEPPAVQTKYF